MGQAYLRKVNARMLITLCFFSILTPFIIQDYPINHYNQIQTDDSNYNDIWDDPSNNRIKLDYTPIDSLERTGSLFSITDDLTVYQATSLTLGNGITDQFTISGLAGYSVDSLMYNMTITGKKDIYEQELFSNKDETLDSSVIRAAQAFNVPWDNAVFYGASIYLIVDTAIGGDELELFIVKANFSDGKPDMTDIRTNATNDPYTSLNPITDSIDEILVYYDFHDVILEQGNYFVVANLSIIDGNDGTGFNWRGQQTSVYGDSYIHDGTAWGSTLPKDFGLTMELMPSDENGTALVFSDPTMISLEDGPFPITSLTDTISSTGTHTLSADTYVDIDLNNSYTFTRTYSGTSSFQVTNSSFNEESVDWDISWSVDAVDFSAYSNPIRSHTLLTPNDWNDTSLSFLLNAITPLTGQKITNGFTVDLQSLISGSTYTMGDISFSTTSTNYLYDYTLTDGSIETTVFNLGYWSTDGVNATGYEGSTVSADILIKDSTLTDITTGELNYTIFNSAGEIIPFKTSIYANLSYTDTSYYTLLSTTQVSAGLYEMSTAIDPSVYGTDVEGFWTVMYFWNNGSEAGFYTHKISVNKPTLAEFFVEDEVGGNYVEISTTEITRINGEVINVKVSYYNISDPFFSGIGTYISAGDVYYSASWTETNNLIFGSGNYSYGLTTDIITGNYTIDLFAQGPFMKSHSVLFSLVLLHQFSLEVEQSQYPIHYKEDSEIIFALRDVSNGSVLISPDSIIISVNGSVLTDISEYDYSFVNNFIEITIYNEYLEYLPASYEVEIIVSKASFVESIGVEQTSTTSSYEIIDVVDTTITPITTVSETNTSSQVTLTFEWMDETHSEQIKGATVVVSLDIPEPDVDVTENSENDGIYTIKIRIQEPAIKTLNVRVTVSKEGYDSVVNFILTTISIKTPAITTPSPSGGLPIGLIIGLSLVAVAGLGVSAFIFTRTQLSKRKEAHEEQKSKARAIYQSAFMIKRIIVVHHETSSPIYEYNLDDRAELDPSIISGVLQAISSIGAEMSGARTGVKKIEYYNFVVSSASSGAYTAYVFSDTELEVEFEEGLFNLVKWFDVIFGYEGAQWEGSMDVFNEYRSSINEKVVEELFLWLMFPLKVDPQTVENLNTLKTIDQEIISFINSKGKATPALITDQLDEYSNEEILERIMVLVKEEKLTTNNNDAAT
ncbi:MAG: hypothetical protein ACTSQ4_04950 [Candidatus Heimdallarchaeaceae archaeon]